MVRKEYSAGGVKHPFWFLEFKKAAILRDQGVTWEGLRTRSREENLFFAASPARAEMTCNTVEVSSSCLPCLGIHSRMDDNGLTSCLPHCLGYLI